MSAKDGGPAFPVRQEGPNLTSWQEPGMTLRDYFAAKAIAGILANPDISASSARLDVSTEEFRSATTSTAYAIADHMLLARKS